MTNPNDTDKLGPIENLIIDMYGDRTERVKVGSEAVLVDVDTEEDYDRFKMQDARCRMTQTN